mgnify:CR=1 FL=1
MNERKDDDDDDERLYDLNNNNDDDNEILDAEIVPVLDLESLTVAVLKDMCIKEGLSRSGNKSELIERLHSKIKSR